MNYPEIVIKDAWLLRQNASKHLHKLWATNGETLADEKEIAEIVANYKSAWKPVEYKIIRGMCETFDLEFRHNIIDVYVAPWFFAFSDPLVVGVTYKPDKFIDVLTHELLHRLLTVNTKVDIDQGRRLKWKKLFGKEHDFGTLVHIPVHAGLKAVYLDVLKEPERLKRDIDECKKYPSKSYSHAWDYVETHDYKLIIEKLRESYS